MALLVEDDDAWERVDALVRRVAFTLTPKGLLAIPTFIAALALVPAGPWDNTRSSRFSRG
ncbi:hypothetical protein [Methylobacterium sp. XJLW]|uniref:hypothetical protein n=1 Tax=Methylobacterium sp. XJLW TaxID=739141 RepID=UPI000F54D9AE|nr:hypothetical protein [Methylobacterium sp. XJLW]